MFIVHKTPVFIFSFLPVLGFAQEISAISVEPIRVGVGEPVRIAVTFGSGNNVPWCGLKLSFGDGNIREIRIGEKEIPLIVSHRYQGKGNFTITVEGQSIVRGLKSAAACSGAPKSVVANVVDLAAEREEARRKVEMEERERLLRGREEELRRREYEEKERLLKAREEELRRRELEEKEREAALKEREKELWRRSVDSLGGQATPPVAPTPKRDRPSKAGAQSGSAPSRAEKPSNTLDAF